MFVRGRLGVGVCSCLEGREKWSAWRSRIWGTNSGGAGRCPRDHMIKLIFASCFEKHEAESPLKITKIKHCCFMFCKT